MLRQRTELLFIIAGLVLLLIGCSGPAAAPTAQVTIVPNEDVAVAQAEPTAAPTEALAAVVNGQPITLAAFQEELQSEEARLAEVGMVPADRTAFERTVLNMMIDQVLIEQAAALQGLEVTEAELDAEIALDIEVAGGQEAWLAWLAENDMTPESYRKSIRSALLTTKIRDLVVAAVPDVVEQVHARHILVSTAEEAQAVYQQLLEGADFGELAFQHSRDVSTRELGGDLGWFAKEQLTEPVVAEVAFALEPGQISEPVASRLGYHIIQTLDHVQDRPLDDLARVTLYEMTFERWRQSLWDQASIERFVGE
ncbi:MAG: hypothetical protein Kow0077_07780 [Anaerolineae bacterium]